MTGATQVAQPRRPAGAQERKYKCAYCARAFSRSEHRSRHERSHTKERPFKCLKCRSTFVRRDLLLRHDRTVHAKDGGVPLHSEVKRRAAAKTQAPAAQLPIKPKIAMEPTTLDHLENSDLETAAALITELHHAANAILVREEQQSSVEERLMAANPELPVFDRAPYPSLAHLPWDVPVTPGYSDCDQMSRSSSQSSGEHWDPLEKTTPADQIRPTHPNSPVTRTVLEYKTPKRHSSGFSTPTSPMTPTSAPLAPPQVDSDVQRQAILRNISEWDMEKALENFRLPSRSALNRYFSAYFTLFHHHFPFLHAATFDAATAEAPLLLAVLSVGALYTFEREQSFMLHVASKQLATSFLSRNTNFSSRNCPLWNIQTTLLNMIFASWSGDASGLEWACSVKSLLANMVTGGKYELQLRLEQRRGSAISKEDWIKEEAAKRTFFSVYNFYGLLTMTFNHTPAICNNEFDSLRLPCSESLWNCDLSDERFWREQLAQAAMPTFKEAQNSLFHGGVPPRYSAFGARVMINALFLDVWQVKRSPDSLSKIVTGYTEKLNIALETWQRSLDLCTPETMIVSLTAPQRGPPLLFNAMAMYRATCARLEVDYASIQEALRYHAPHEVSAAMTSAASSVPRSQGMTKVIQLCFECFQIPALMGIRLFAKSSALNWSPEHILFGFDLMLILSLWLNRLEEEHEEYPPNEEELSMLNKVKSLFDEDSVERGSKLSAAVAKIWGGMLDEVVVWGITRTMGESFKLHSLSLEDDDDSGSMTTTTTSTNTPGPCSPVSHNDDMDLGNDH